MKEKQEIRKRVRRWRTFLLNDFSHSVSDQVIHRLLNVPEIKSADSIMSYRAMAGKGEISLDGMEDSLSALFVYPKVISSTEMEAMIPTKGWALSRLGIMEPVGEIFEEQPDVCLVPMLAADRRGNRLGYGAGYYDRFLGHETGIKIGICYQEWLLDELPTEDFDVAVDILVTESQTLRIG